MDGTENGSAVLLSEHIFSTFSCTKVPDSCQPLIIKFGSLMITHLILSHQMLIWLVKRGKEKKLGLKILWEFGGPLNCILSRPSNKVFKKPNPKLAEDLDDIEGPNLSYPLKVFPFTTSDDRSNSNSFSKVILSDSSDIACCNSRIRANLDSSFDERLCDTVVRLGVA